MANTMARVFKKRLCRYLLQHYLGHFFKEKISLEQLSIDIYNGTGCVKNLHLDCDALNDQLNSQSSSTGAPNGLSSVPIEIVSGFVGYISVYIPWHDLFNDYCKLTIKNVQITIRAKQQQRKPSSTTQGNFYANSNTNARKSSNENSEELGSSFSDESDSNPNSMFSSMFIDSIMNTSMHIAQECFNEDSAECFSSDLGGKHSSDQDPTKSNSLLGLEAFASTIDSILSRIKINLEQIQIRIENIHNDKPSDLMSSSTLFQNRPSNGIALELRIKSIKYFDLDSVSPSQSSQSTTSTNSLDPGLNSLTQTNLVRNTTKSFNVEGLTIYFDEFIVRDDYEQNNQENMKQSSSSSLGKHDSDLNSLNSTIDLNETSNTTLADDPSQLTTSLTNPTTQPSPVDESAPFNFELNPDYYLYTNPIIMLTFSGIQSIKLTINNLRPTDLILEAASSGQDFSTKLNQQLKDQQRPFLEVNAQFGSIKCLLCPKQIHLLIEMINKLIDYVEAANAAKRAIKKLQLSRKSSQRSNRHKSRSVKNLNTNGISKPVRGCDKRKFESLLQNDLIFNPNADYFLENDDEDQEEGEDEEELLDQTLNDNFKSLLNNDPNEASSMFYSMMSESTLNSCPHVPGNNMNNMNQSNYSTTTEHENENFSNFSNFSNNELDEDKNQILFTRHLKQTIEQLQSDVIKHSQSLVQNQSQNQHNLFQTFKITLREFSITVLHHDPPLCNDSKSTSDQNLNLKNKSMFQLSSTKRFIVERMKQISDTYFDWVSTIDTSTLSQSSSTPTGIEKHTILKYHQACAFNDHFLVLLKPINLNLIQKMNQRNVTKSKTNCNNIQYSLNDATITIGYIQLDEYLVAEERQDSSSNKNDKNSNSNSNSNSNKRRFKNELAIEACQSATITELVHFVDASSSSSSQSAQIEQPCLKAQLVLYEPINLTNRTNRQNKKFNSNSTNENYFLNRSFENIQIQLNQSLVFELDISIVDRLYYLLNDISKMSNANINQQNAKPMAQNNSNGDKIRNFEIKCSQVVKLGLRFPIADLRRTQQPKTFFTKSNEMSTSTLNSTSSSSLPVLKPVTMTAFRHLRDQILTLHIFDLSFQTLLNAPCNPSSGMSDLLLTITSSQINAYYQYNKKERPIHFGLIQQKLSEPRSLIFSIKIPIEKNQANLMPDDDSQLLTDELFAMSHVDTQTIIELDSLKHQYNINVGKANRFTFRTNQTIREESETDAEIENKNKNKNRNENRQNVKDEMDDEDDDDESYGPFSRIHTLISSEKNRRIVNAGNKSEMSTFMSESRSNSQITIKLNLPEIKFLIADQKFLNDVYNCFLNDLIMWVPIQLPPIESSLHIYDPVTNTFIAPSLGYLIDSNLDTEFFFANAHINLQNDFGNGNEQEENDDKQFHMCKSAILKPGGNEDSNSDAEECCESDTDVSKRKYNRDTRTSQSFKPNSNSLKKDSTKFNLSNY